MSYKNKGNFFMFKMKQTIVCGFVYADLKVLFVALWYNVLMFFYKLYCENILYLSHEDGEKCVISNLELSPLMLSTGIQLLFSS